MLIYIVVRYEGSRKNGCNIFSAGIGYLFMIYSSGRDEGNATSSLPPIKTRGGRYIAKSDFEENDDSKGILFSTDIYCNIIKCSISSLMYSYL